MRDLSLIPEVEDHWDCSASFLLQPKRDIGATTALEHRALQLTSCTAPPAAASDLAKGTELQVLPCAAFKQQQVPAEEGRRITKRTL